MLACIVVLRSGGISASNHDQATGYMGIVRSFTADVSAVHS